MPRPVILFSGAFADLPLEELAAKAADWGYAGFELSAGGKHLDVRAPNADDLLALFAKHDLQVPVVANFRVGQAIGDVIDNRHREILPPHVWGDGQPKGVQARAIEEMIATIHTAQKLGAAIVSGFIGSPIWSYVNGYPGPRADVVDAAFARFAEAWHPILDVCQGAGVRFALEIHPGQLAFDYHSAARLLESIDRRPEFGFCIDPSHFHLQGMDPAMFVREFGDRIYHVHAKDIALALDGKNGLLNSYLPYGDPRRGWEFRSPGRGGVEWENLIRALNSAGYDGPLSVDWRDEALDREFGVEEACRFVKQLDFPARKPPEASAFR